MKYARLRYNSKKKSKNLAFIEVNDYIMVVNQILLAIINRPLKEIVTCHLFASRTF